jgi:hypothetical protein
MLAWVYVVAGRRNAVIAARPENGTKTEECGTVARLAD